MNAPQLPAVIADRTPSQLRRIMANPVCDDITFRQAAIAIAYLDSLVVHVPRHRRLWGWRVLQGGKDLPAGSGIMETSASAGGPP